MLTECMANYTDNLGILVGMQVKTHYLKDKLTKLVEDCPCIIFIFLENI